MAMEAAQQMASTQPNREITGYLIKEARFLNPIVVREPWEERIEGRDSSLSGKETTA